MELDQNRFIAIVKQMTDEDCNNLALMLQFCCGLNPKAAEIILSHVVDLSMLITNWWQKHVCALNVHSINKGLESRMMRLPLLLFNEIRIPAFTSFLRPFCLNEHLSFGVGISTQRRHALQYFLDCQLKYPQYNVLNHVQSATIHFSYINLPTSAAAHDLMIVGSLLQCLSNLTSLEARWDYDVCEIFSDYQDAILNGFCKLRKLESLTFAGADDISSFVESLGRCKTLTTLTKITITTNERIWVESNRFSGFKPNGTFKAGHRSKPDI